MFSWRGPLSNFSQKVTKWNLTQQVSNWFCVTAFVTLDFLKRTSLKLLSKSNTTRFDSNTLVTTRSRKVKESMSSWLTLMWWWCEFQRTTFVNSLGSFFNGMHCTMIVLLTFHPIFENIVLQTLELQEWIVSHLKVLI